MISQQIIDRKGKAPTVRCVLCHEEAKYKPQVIQLGVEFCIICPKCIENFSRTDMEFMHNMFSAFGGFFGQLKNNKSSLNEVIKKLATEFNVQKEDITLKSDIGILHKAFLYGIAPSQVAQGCQINQEK
jgi:hypothetical protein